MEQAIARLEWTLKDVDVSADEELVALLQKVIAKLRWVMAVKRERWAKQEKEMGACPCKSPECLAE